MEPVERPVSECTGKKKRKKKKKKNKQQQPKKKRENSISLKKNA